MRKHFLLLAAGVAVSVPLPLFAHPGGLDANGCHTNRKTGDYHCHRAPAPEGSSSGAGPPVKKSTSGICHDRKSQYYSRTKNFTVFQTMKACIESGGRPPK
jgi:hypothetical protein